VRAEWTCDVVSNVGANGPVPFVKDPSGSDRGNQIDEASAVGRGERDRSSLGTAGNISHMR
jgi:hypothetical protein